MSARPLLSVSLQTVRGYCSDSSLQTMTPVSYTHLVYLTADEEDRYRVVKANETIDENGHVVKNNVSGRVRADTTEFPKSKVDLMDVSPKMVFSVATSMIPFLQNDDANRCLLYTSRCV